MTTRKSRPPAGVRSTITAPATVPVAHGLDRRLRGVHRAQHERLAPVRLRLARAVDEAREVGRGPVAETRVGRRDGDGRHACPVGGPHGERDQRDDDRQPHEEQGRDQEGPRPDALAVLAARDQPGVACRRGGRPHAGSSAGRDDGVGPASPPSSTAPCPEPTGARCTSSSTRPPDVVDEDLLERRVGDLEVA